MSGKIWWLALLCCAALAVPAAAQEGATKDEVPAQVPPPADEAKQEPPPPSAAPAKNAQLESEPMNRWGAITISLAGWKPSMVGSDPEVAVVFPANHAPYTLLLGSEANLRASWLVAYHLPKNLGTISLHYDSMNYDDEHEWFSPGRFIYGETQAFPGFRGAFDDGLADGVRATAFRKAREVRLEFSDTLSETKRTRVTWGAGVHNLDYSQELQVYYYALVPNLPPIIPPVVTPPPDPAIYAPRPDYVVEASDFSGAGVGASLDVEFRLAPRFSIISGLSLGLLRGDVDTSYQSLTSFYFTSDGGLHYLSKDELFDILNNGTDQQIRSIGQETVKASMYDPGISQAAQTIDAYVGIQSNVWKGLRVYAMLREMYYHNVGLVVIPKADLTVETESVSVGYEGYLVGLAWRF